MKKQILFFATVIIAIAIFSCRGRKEDSKADSIRIVDSLSTKIALNDSIAKAQTGTFSKFEQNTKGRKFIRTANLKFKVKNAIKSTYSIEDLTAKYGGFVTYTNLRTNVNTKTILPISTDSSLETTYYNVENDIVIRVPNNKLDSLLKEISNLISFLDYRIIKADDVTLCFISNQMKENRFKNFDKRYTKAIDEKSKKLTETTNAEEKLLEKQNQSDDLKIQTMSTQNQVEYSTINLNIYQNQVLLREKIENEKNIEAFKPSIVKRIIEAFVVGWNVFENIIVFLISIWWLFSIAFVVFLIYKAINRKNNSLKK